MRRTKATKASDIQLPNRVVKIRAEPFSAEENDFYQALYTQSQAQFNTYVAQGTVLNNYAHIFDILIRLRQAVNHPYLVTHSDRRHYEAEQVFMRPESADAEDTRGVVCGFCEDVIFHHTDKRSKGSSKSVVTGSCGHFFCRPCLATYRDDENKSVLELQCVVCPICQESSNVDLEDNSGGALVSTALRKSSILNRIDLSSFHSSTKIEALLQV